MKLLNLPLLHLLASLSTVARRHGGTGSQQLISERWAALIYLWITKNPCASLSHKAEAKVASCISSYTSHDGAAEARGGQHAYRQHRGPNPSLTQQ